MDIPSRENLLSLNNTTLTSLCRNLGIAKGSRLDMVKNLENLVISKKRKRTTRISSRDLPSPPSKKRILSTTLENIPTHGNVYAATLIQKFWRSNKFAYTNDTDFLSLEPITVPPFRLVEDSKNIYRFHPMSLATYFLKEGKFINPYTRRVLYPVELRRLDRMVKTYDTTFVCLYEEHQRLTIKRAEEREHERTCYLLHNESLRLLQDIMTLTQDEQAYMPSVMFELLNVSLPRYFHTFRQLYMLDYSFACDSILFICTSLKVMWEDPTIANTPKRCHIIETTQYSIMKFCHQLLPIFGMLLPDFTGINIQVHNNEGDDENVDDDYVDDDDDDDDDEEIDESEDDDVIILETPEERENNNVNDSHVNDSHVILVQNRSEPHPRVR